jgi:GNAT superfamily N-acetyltransferase
MNVSSDARRSTPPQNLSAGPMSAASPQWVHPLRNGAQVIIRPIGKDDAALERAFIESLSAQSRRFRFLGQIGCPSDALIRQLTDIDYVHDVAFVALANVGGKAQEIGVARYSIADGERSCECAVAVSDDFHHLGVGTLLMNHLIDIARERGIREMLSIDSAENFGMRDLAQSLGFERAPDPDDGTQVIHRLTL